jgi:serine phosphatase RsbU (regulator of sigma subunit)
MRAAAAAAAVFLMFAGTIRSSCDPPIICNSHVGQFFESEGGNILLGISGDVEYGTYEIPAAPGSVIFLGSDSVWEMFGNAGDQRCKRRLEEVIAQHSQKTSEEIKTCCCFHSTNSATARR